MNWKIVKEFATVLVGMIFIGLLIYFWNAPQSKHVLINHRTAEVIQFYKSDEVISLGVHYDKELTPGKSFYWTEDRFGRITEYPLNEWQIQETP
jgi:hypothetical protein